MKGFFMVNLVVSSGTEFASVTVESGVVLYVDGTEADAPFFWAMGERFAMRVEQDGRCPNCDNPIWVATFSERSFNGEGAELVRLGEIGSESSATNTPLLAGAFLADLMSALSGEAALASFLGVETTPVLLVQWASEVAEALYPLAQPAFEAWEAEQVGFMPDAYSESFASIVADEV